MEPREYELAFAHEDAHWWFRSRRALVFRLLRRYGGRPGLGLDVGCGTGGTLRALGSQGRWIGLDAAPLALALSARRGLGRLVRGSVEALPFRSDVFDACLLLDVLYHRTVASERDALAECHRVLRPGGLLLVTDSALPWLRSGHDVAVHGARRYTRRALAVALAAAGFRVLFASYTVCLLFPVIAAFRLARRGRDASTVPRSDVFPLPAPLNLLLLAIQAVERALLRLAPLPLGSSVVCVGRKGGAPAP